MIERRIHLAPHAFWVREAGTGTPLVLVHGLSGSSRWWDRNLDELAKHHRVLAVDLIGFGRNRRLVGSALPLSIDETASLLARHEIRSSIAAVLPKSACRSRSSRAAMEPSGRTPRASRR